MVQKGTVLSVSDNSGAKTVICINNSKGFKKRTNRIGDIILVSVKSLKSKRKLNSTLTKGNIHKAVIIRTKNQYSTFYGQNSKFLQNSVILISKQNKFLFSRIFGAIPKIFRYTKFMRIITLASGVL